MTQLASFLRPRRTGFAAALACVSFVTLMATSRADAAAFVLAYTDGQISQSYTNLQAYHGQLSAVGLGSAYNLTSSGSVGTDGMTNTTRSIISFAKSKGLPLYPTVSDYNNGTEGFDPAISKAVLATATSRAKAVTNLVSLATTNGFAGIDIDLEAVNSSDKANYSTFIASLADALHGQGLKLVISVPPKTGDKAPDYLGGYDYAAIGAAVDYFQVMTYDEVGPGWASSGFNGEAWPGPESGLDWQKAILSYTVSRVPASKVLAGLPSYGYDYSTGQTVYWSRYPAVLAAHAGVTYQRDVASATPYATWGTVSKQADGIKWSNTTKQPVLWYDDAQSIQAKTALVNAYGLAGTSVWAMGYEDASFWSAVKSGLDNGAAAPLSIDAAAGAGGSITPSGAVQVLQGHSQSFSIVPNAGYGIASVTVDGASVGAVSSYTFGDVQAGHSIRAAFSALGGSGDTQIEAAGTGQVWTKNASALLNTNRQTRPGINDGKLGIGVVLNAAGEGETGKWEAAGITWSAAKTVSKVVFINGAIDSYGNGYFESGVSLQYTTDGTHWLESGWAITPAYPNSAAAAGVSYAFSGTPLAGVLGVRVSGKTGPQAWSAIINEVQVTGR